MSSSDPRGARLHTLDAQGEAFVAAFAGRGEAGPSVARGDIETLAALAHAIAHDLALWRPLVQRLDLARDGDFDTRRAGALILETVFDELLEPHAWRVLAAALDLAERGA